MKTHLLETNGHYYLSTLPDLWDFLAVVMSFASTLAVMLLVWRAVALLLRHPRQARWRVLCALIIASGVGYTILYAFDVPSVLMIVSNPGGDVPVLSSVRTACTAGLLFTLAAVLNGATRLPEVVREPF